MHYTKLILAILLVVFSITTNAQTGTGFAKDVRIDTAGKYLKDSYLKAKRPFITDHTVGHLSQGFLFNDIDLSSYELLVANLSFSDKDQVQKINLQPFKLVNRDLTPLLTNVKLNIVQKKDISTFGLGTGGDNSLPTSKRGERLREEIYKSQPVPQSIVRDVTQFDRRRAAINSLTADPALKTILLEQVNAEQKVYEESLFDNYVKNVLTPFKSKLDSLLLAYDEKRAMSVFKWTVGYNLQYFSILSAKGNANDFDSLNHHSQKANVATITASYSYDRNCFSLSGTYNYIDSRKSAVKGIEKIHYDGYSFSAAKRIKRFLPDDDLRKSAAYIKSLFIPSVNLGFIWELKETDATKFLLIEEGIKRQRVFTPYFDLLIAPAAQFRISLPVQKNTMVDGSKQTFLGATVQYGLKFSNLN